MGALTVGFSKRSPYVTSERHDPQSILDDSLPPSASHPRSIGLLGGSFNPAHGGHREISLTALQRLGLEAVWWLVTPGNPLKTATAYAYDDYDTRLQTARRVSDHPNIVVSDFERRHELNYTVETIQRLKDLYPDVVFIWMMGADSLWTFHQWKDWRRIASLAPIAVFSRPGAEDAAEKSDAAIALQPFRIKPEQGPLLASQEPPVWLYFDDIVNSSSATAIRTNSQKMEPRSK